ncbi:MAG: HAMP domain-containing sensor histidine kinase [Byssovorax sp.]
MLIAAPFCLVASIGGAVFLSRRALAPLEAVIAETRSMESADLGRRLHVPARDDELRDLTVGLNELIERLEAGFEALGSYAASASHELRTPLAVVISELEVGLRRPRSSDEWARIAETSLDELRRLTALVASLLAVSGDAASSIVITTLAVAGLVEGAQHAAACEAQEKRVDLAPPSGDLGVDIRGNPELLGAALTELLRNAVRYSASGGTVRVRVEALDDARAAVHVDDDGPGVTADESAAIFQWFTRGAEGRTADARAQVRERRGHGLGLAIAQRSVGRCGGELRVSGSPEGGARFSMILERAPIGA